MTSDKYRPYLIIWRDASSDDAGWHYRDDLEDQDLVCYTLGFKIHEYPTHIVYADSQFRADGDPVGGINRIPTKMIIAEIPLRLPKYDNLVSGRGHTDRDNADSELGVDIFSVEQSKDSRGKASIKQRRK